MRHFHLTRNKYHCPTLNLDKLWTLVPEDKRSEAIKSASESNAPVIDVVQHGFYKVLGKGELPTAPVIVKARFFSRKTEEKIREAGGVCVTTT